LDRWLAPLTGSAESPFSRFFNPLTFDPPLAPNAPWGRSGSSNSLFGSFCFLSFFRSVAIALVRDHSADRFYSQTRVYHVPASRGDCTLPPPGASNSCRLLAWPLHPDKLVFRGAREQLVKAFNLGPCQPGLPRGSQGVARMTFLAGFRGCTGLEGFRRRPPGFFRWPFSRPPFFPSLSRCEVVSNLRAPLECPWTRCSMGVASPFGQVPLSPSTCRSPPPSSSRALRGGFPFRSQPGWFTVGSVIFFFFPWGGFRDEGGRFRQSRVARPIRMQGLSFPAYTPVCRTWSVFLCPHCDGGGPRDTCRPRFFFPLGAPKSGFPFPLIFP